jgi:flavin-dependent dehydrogenase
MTSVPCIVVGGGLAGAACALELARNGCRVVILERTRTAHHKVCGEFLSVEAQALISHLGLDIWKLGATEINSFHLVCGADFPAVGLPFRAAGLSRFRLDEALLQAAALAGAEVVRGAPVTRLEEAGGSVVVHTLGQRFRATCVVLATGKHDLRDHRRSRGSMVAFKLQLRVRASAAATLRNTVHMTVFPGGYVGACLVEDGVVTVCWVLEQKLLARIGSSWQAQARHLSLQSNLLGELLADAHALWESPVAVAGIPYGFLRRRVVSQSIYPVGDQLAVIPSNAGNGMSIALHSGIAAARAILNEQPAGDFQRVMASTLRRQMAWARAGNVLLSNAIMQRLAATLGQVMPWAQPKAVAFLINATRLRGLEPPTAAR